MTWRYRTRSALFPRENRKKRSNLCRDYQPGTAPDCGPAPLWSVIPGQEYGQLVGLVQDRNSVPPCVAAWKREKSDSTWIGCRPYGGVHPGERVLAEVSRLPRKRRHSGATDYPVSQIVAGEWVATNSGNWAGNPGWKTNADVAAGHPKHAEYKRHARLAMEG